MLKRIFKRATISLSENSDNDEERERIKNEMSQLFDKLLEVDPKSWESLDVIKALGRGKNGANMAAALGAAAAEQSEVVANAVNSGEIENWQVASPELVSLYRITFFSLTVFHNFADRLPSTNPIKGRVELYIGHVAYQLQACIKQMSTAAGVQVPLNSSQAVEMGRTSVKKKEAALETKSRVQQARDSKKGTYNRTKGTIKRTFMSIGSNFQKARGIDEVLERYWLPKAPKTMSSLSYFAMLYIPFGRLADMAVSEAGVFYGKKNDFFEFKNFPVGFHNEKTSIRALLLDFSYFTSSLPVYLSALAHLVTSYQRTFHNALEMKIDDCSDIRIDPATSRLHLAAVTTINDVSRCYRLLTDFDVHYGNELNPFFKVTQSKQQELFNLRKDVHWLNIRSPAENSMFQMMAKTQGMSNFIATVDDVNPPLLFRLFEILCAVTRVLRTASDDNEFRV